MQIGQRYYRFPCHSENINKCIPTILRICTFCSTRIFNIIDSISWWDICRWFIVRSVWQISPSMRRKKVTLMLQFLCFFCFFCFFLFFIFQGCIPRVWRRVGLVGPLVLWSRLTHKYARTTVVTPLTPLLTPRWPCVDPVWPTVWQCGCTQGRTGRKWYAPI